LIRSKEWELARLTREESQALTRAQLLDCAPQVVAREGFEGASIDKIAEAAGFSKGAFYSNFSSKEEFFLELLERHAGQDVVEIARLLDGVVEPGAIIDRVCDWAKERAADPTWGLLALELFRRARRDATLGSRHATLFRDQWRGVGELLLPIAPGWTDPEPEVLGAVVLELTYGAASAFNQGVGPGVDDLVRLALSSLNRAYGAAH
jgi:AcrR family transcriptional regulator